VAALFLTLPGPTVASLRNQEDSRGSDNAAKEFRFALNHQTGIFVDLVSNLTKGFLDHQEAVATSTSSQLVELHLSYGALSQEFKELRKEFYNLKADFLTTKTGSDTFKEELKSCQSEVKIANQKISFLTEKIEHEVLTANDKITTVAEKLENGLATANDKISSVTEKVKNGLETTNNKISILSHKVDLEVSNMAAKVEREVKSANDKISIVSNLVDIESKATNNQISIMTEKVEHHTSVMVAEVGVESCKGLSSLADKINRKIEATNISVQVLADKLEQQRQNNTNIVTHMPNIIEHEVASVNKNISVIMEGVHETSKNLTDKIGYQEQNNSNKIMALEAIIMYNLTSTNTVVSLLEDKVGNEMQNANQKILEMVKKVEQNQLKNSIYFDASRKTNFATGTLTYDDMTASNDSGMDPSSGKFKANIAGVYVFTFNAISISGKKAYTNIVHNGVRLGSAFTSGQKEYNMIGQSVIVQLAKNDLVWVTVNNYGIHSNSAIYIHFTGYILNPLE